MTIRINRLTNGIAWKGLLQVGQVNCHNKRQLIDGLSMIGFDLLLVHELEAWFKNKKHSSWMCIMADATGSLQLMRP